MNRQFELLNLKACKIWYMLDGSYVAVKTVGSKSLIAKKKKFFFLYLHRTVQQTTLWLDYMESPHLQSVIKVKIFFIYRIYSNYLGPTNILYLSLKSLHSCVTLT